MISPSFSVLLNCLCLSPWVLPFFWFSPSSHCGVEWANSCVLFSCLPG